VESNKLGYSDIVGANVSALVLKVSDCFSEDYLLDSDTGGDSEVFETTLSFFAVWSLLIDDCSDLEDYSCLGASTSALDA
jgi:hypothetical protein